MMYYANSESAAELIKRALIADFEEGKANAVDELTEEFRKKMEELAAHTTVLMDKLIRIQSSENMYVVKLELPDKK